MSTGKNETRDKTTAAFARIVRENAKAFDRWRANPSAKTEAARRAKNAAFLRALAGLRAARLARG